MFGHQYIKTFVRVKRCIQCQRAKVNKHIQSASVQFPTPDIRFEHIHMDIVEPLLLSQGYQYCATIIERVSK